jgi:WD40 repeat protein
MAALNTLPNEILSLITTHLERPKDLLSFSTTSRRIYEFAKLDGWKALLKGRFGLNGLDKDARNSIHDLTTLYRNWDRKGFVARYLEPSEKVMSMNTWQPEKWRGPQGQTMGYQPSIDSYEELYGGWGERREVLAWSAGTQIVMRTKETGSNIEKIRSRDEGREQESGRTWTYDAFKHLNTWFTYKIPDSFEGRDDITRLKLLRPDQRDLAYENIVFGTASGQLSLLSVSPDHAETRIQQYETGQQGVNGISISSSSEPMLAAVLADSSLALFPVNRGPFSEEPIKPSTEVRSDLAPIGRLWSCNFLSDDKVAVGLGPHPEPVEVYQIGPDGFVSEPLRKFDTAVSGKYQSHPTSVYPILSIPGTAQGGSEAGNTFLSGGYDGIIRLHDMRSPRGFETMFWDPTNDSPVYSLAAQGLERIVAGVAMHSMIKVFDLRFSGSNAYHTVSMPSKTKSKGAKQDSASNAIVDKSRGGVSTVSGGWNLYLNPRVPPSRNAYRHDYSRVRDDSPVYSLSIPSATSQNVYAGLEGAVQSLTFHGIADPYPDAMLSQSLTRYPDSGAVDVQASYNQQGDVLNLGMYERAEEELGMQLLVQDGVTANAAKKERKDKAEAKGLDERWLDLRDAGERWSRGEVPRAHRRTRGRGRGGRGRGRGA